jgi:hypothetical protein
MVNIAIPTMHHLLLKISLVHLSASWIFGLLATAGAIVVFSVKNRTVMLMASPLSGGAIFASLGTAGQHTAAMVVAAGVTCNILQGFVHDGLLDRKHHLLRWAIAGAAIVTALLLQPPAHWVDWIPVLGYAWGQGASTLRNVQMRIWLLPATALWLVFAAVTAVWPIVLLESMTFMVNLITIDRLTRNNANLRSLALAKK